ncbi:LacI family DNA-binding transcriptional regulator [Ruegeria sp. HKCCD8929]|uniref:LacI family DNA-binding transcriptional regulator n=1 Tax=Ruegeria sp. HKCCD8929 TaxID=2683006 RepID=UPI001487CFBD|nr:LacI family DNA-binding transcriptional regulator [Ruegeria sp. HKCCD8929]
MKKVGIKDVAERAGVSIATVSYVMNDSGRVGKTTKQLVLDAASELGFVRDNGAARLRTGQSRLIGVIINNVVNPFFSELVAGAELAAYQEGFLTIVATAQNDRERQTKLLHSMMSQGVGAIILTPVHDTTGDDLQVVRQRHIPVVSCVRDLPGAGASFVGVDEEKSGYMAAKSLIEAGHDKMAFVGGYADTTTWIGRRNGIFRALKENGLPKTACRLSPGSLSPDFAASTVSRLFATGELGEALIAFNDDMAAGVYRALRQNSVVVGEQVSVVSFDNVPIARALDPNLTTVDINPRRIGEKSAQLAMELLASKSVSRQELILKPAMAFAESIRAKH